MADKKRRKKRESRDHDKVDLATALGNPWRFRIIFATTEELLSPSQFVRKYGGEISSISRHFRHLEEWGYLEKVETVTGGEHRGAKMNVFRAARRAQLDMPASKALPQVLRSGISNTVLGSFLEKANAAIEADTLDADVERQLSWDLVDLDMQGFRTLSHWLDEILARLPGLQKEAKQRMAVSGEDPITTTVGLFSFRTPPLPDLPTGPGGGEE